MPIDANIYSNVQTPSVSPLDTADKAMRLSALGLQNQQMGYQMQMQNAVRGAYARNTDPQSGQLNRAGFLSDLGKAAPMAASEYQNQFTKQDKEAAEAKTAQMQTAHQTLSVTTPALQYLLKLPDDQAAKAFPGVMAQLKDQGIPMHNVPPSWDRGWAQQGYAIGSKMKEGLENQMIQSNIATAPAKLNADLYGSRSPNAELTGQYDKQADSVRKSQFAMKQMMDNYNNTSPQGDASLVLNAFKIKFPNAPDVASLDELSHAEGTTPQMKNWVSQKLAGLKDPGVRDDLMRDGISTYRANVESLQGIQKRFQARQKFQGVNDPTMTYEPAINDTYNQAMGLQKKIGPYVPPTDKNGSGGFFTKTAAKLLGVGGAEKAEASSSNDQNKFRKTGSMVSADEAAKYAIKHGLKLDAAKESLRSLGYVVN